MRSVSTFLHSVKNHYSLQIKHIGMRRQNGLVKESGRSPPGTAQPQLCEKTYCLQQVIHLAQLCSGSNTIIEPVSKNYYLPPEFCSMQLTVRWKEFFEKYQLRNRH